MMWTERCRRWLIFLLPAALALQGCVLLIGGAAVGGAVVATDRRSTGMQMEDQRIELKIQSALNDRIPKGAMHINAISYDGKVLLVGEVRTEPMREQATEAARHVDNVREVINEVTVAEPSSFGDRTDDTLVSGKVKTAILSADGVPTGVVTTTVNQGVVYLMGKVTPAESEAAATAARRVDGVRRVVKLFSLITDKQVAEIKKEQAESPNSAKDAKNP